MRLSTPFIFIVLATNAFAHGEDSPGPNDGHVKMVGTFHVETVKNSDATFDVYLLDVDFKNATVKNSKVEMSVAQTSGTINFACTADKKHFHCVPPKKDKLSEGTLIVKTSREGAEGEVRYDLPLQWKKVAMPSPTVSP